MSRFGRLASVWVALSLSACAASLGAPRPYPLSSDGWTPQVAELRSVSLGLPGGTQLADGVMFAGGLQVSAARPQLVQRQVLGQAAGQNHREQDHDDRERPEAAQQHQGLVARHFWPTASSTAAKPSARRRAARSRLIRVTRPGPP